MFGAHVSVHDGGSGGLHGQYNSKKISYTTSRRSVNEWFRENTAPLGIQLRPKI